MYGQYHLRRGKNPALSCLIRFVSMDRAKQQNYSSTRLQATVHSSPCRVLLRRKSGALSFINVLVPFADMWDTLHPAPPAMQQY